MIAPVAEASDRPIVLGDGVLAGTLAVVFWRMAERRRDRPAPQVAAARRLVPFAPYARVRADPTARVGIGMVVLAGGGFLGGGVSGGASLRERDGLAEAASGAILAASGRGGVSDRRVVRRLLGRIGERGRDPRWTEITSTTCHGDWRRASPAAAC